MTDALSVTANITFPWASDIHHLSGPAPPLSCSLPAFFYFFPRPTGGEQTRWMPESPRWARVTDGLIIQTPSLGPSWTTTPCLLANSLHLPSPYRSSWLLLLILKRSIVQTDPVMAPDLYLDSLYPNRHLPRCGGFFWNKMLNHLAATSRLAACASRACFPSSRPTHCKCINGFLSPAWCVGVRLCHAQWFLNRWVWATGAKNEFTNRETWRKASWFAAREVSENK